MIPSQLSNGFSNTVVKMLGGTVTHSAAERVQATTFFNSENVRKFAHCLEFTGLGCFATALSLKLKYKLANVLLLGLGIAVIDETIQLFDGRTSMIKDVWIDMSGFMLGMLIVEIIYQILKRNSRLNHISKNKIILMLLVILTLCFIWGNSLMPASVSGTFSERVKDLINILLGHGGSKESLSGDGLLRKIAHASEFGLLGIELPLLFQNRLKEKLTAIATCGLAVAVTDETIQLFVEGRSGQLRDVWIDFAGFTVGVLLVWAICGIIRRIGKRRTATL